MTGKYEAPSVKKAFQILRLIAESREGLGISALAKGLKMGKSTVHGITAALEALGIVTRDPLSKRYTLGLTLLELVRSAYSQIDLREVARPVMEKLMEKAQESVFLGALNGDHVTILDIVESRQDLKITSPLGTTIPLPAAATGKVFLAAMEEDRALAIIKKRGLRKYTENTITEVEAYLEELRRVRRQGYATDFEEYMPGVRAVVVPIRGDRQFMSAIWVVGFKTSLHDKKMETLIRATMEAAEEISQRVSQRSQ